MNKAEFDKIQFSIYNLSSEYHFSLYFVSNKKKKRLKLYVWLIFIALRVRLLSGTIQKIGLLSGFYNYEIVNNILM